MCYLKTTGQFQTPFSIEFKLKMPERNKNLIESFRQILAAMDSQKTCYRTTGPTFQSKKHRRAPKLLLFGIILTENNRFNHLSSTFRKYLATHLAAKMPSSRQTGWMSSLKI